MSDVVVTVPKNFEWYDPKRRQLLRGLEAWIAEGDPAGQPASGVDWYFTLGGYPPKIEQGERVYIVYNGKVRGYAPLLLVYLYEDEDDTAGEYGDLEDRPPRRRIPGYALVRRGGAVAITIDEPIKGFRGFRYRWWKREDEKPFPEWQTP